MKKFFIILITLLSIPWVNAQSIQKLLEKTGKSSDYPGSAYVVIFDSTKVNVEKSGLSHVTEHKLIKILTEEGAKKFNVYKYDYDPLSAYCEIKGITIYKKNGEIKKIDMTKTFDYPAPARMIYWGARQKMSEIGRLEPEDGIEIETYRKGFTYALLTDNNKNDEQYIPPMKGQFYDLIPFYSEVPVISKVYIVTLPSDKELIFKKFNGDISSIQVQHKENFDTFIFEKKDIKPYKKESNMVAVNDVFTKLILTTTKNWEDKSIWFYNVNEDYGSFKPTKQIKTKTDEILQQALTEMDTINFLTHWVADEIRYSGLSMGKGEGYTLHTGEMDFIDRCGVCKDKAGMLITMLRAAGKEAYAAMTMAGEYIENIAADHFNHSVTVVKLNNGQMMLLDPTWVPFTRELWSSREQQQGYLMGLPEGAKLEYTPVSAPQNHYIRIICNSKLLPDGTLEGDLTVRAEGQSDAAVRRIFNGSGDDDFERLLELELKKISPDIQITKLEYTNPNDYLKQPVYIFAKFIIPEYAFSANNTLIYKSITGSGIFKNALFSSTLQTESNNKLYPFRIGCSQQMEIKENIEIPDGFTPTDTNQWNKRYNIPDDGSSCFIASMTKTGNKLEINHTLNLNQRVFAANQWDGVKKRVDAQREMMNKVIVLSK